MGEIIVTTNNKKQVQGITTIEPEVIRKFRANAGIENIFKTLPGVNSNNELVRNMLFEAEITMRTYVNEIEIYRPF
jgi:hypothetical protein